MSVDTEADEKIEDARKHIQKALALLSEVVVGRCDGHENYTHEYKKRLGKAHATLVEVRDDLE